MRHLGVGVRVRARVRVRVRVGVRVRVRVRVSHHDTRVYLLRTYYGSTYYGLTYLVEGVGGVADHMQLCRRKTKPLLDGAALVGL